MDKDGQPLDMSSFGPVYIKYMSAGSQASTQGDAILNGYQGSFRGVYFHPQLADGEFRQYAVLPLFLFDSRGIAPSRDELVARPPADESTRDATRKSAANDSASSRSCWTKERVESLLSPLHATLAQLEATIEVLAVDDLSASVFPLLIHTMIPCCCAIWSPGRHHMHLCSRALMRPWQRMSVHTSTCRCTDIHQVCLNFSGPDVLKFGIANTLQGAGINDVVFHPEKLYTQASEQKDGLGQTSGHSVIEYHGPDR